MAVNVPLVVASYVMGMFPTAILVGRQTGHDPTREGSGNPGATNVYRTSGRRAGLVVGIGDVAKGAIPTLVGLLVDGRPLAAACWVAAVLGHVLPLTRRLRGGKGVATAAGGVLVLLPIVALCCGVIFGLTIKLTRTASLGSILAFALGPVLVWAFGQPRWEVMVTIAVCALVLGRHWSNIKRLVSGDEHVLRRAPRQG